MASENIVLIPCWNRPEFLYCTMSNLKHAKGGENCKYIFCIDRGYDPEILEVINQFPIKHEIRFAPDHGYRGNSFNVLESYRYALGIANQDDLIFLVEEDIFVSRDFFDYHKCVQARFPSFCVSAVKCQNDNLTAKASLRAAKVSLRAAKVSLRETKVSLRADVIYYHDSFQSLGISWKPHQLEKVVKHAVPAFYDAPLLYMYTEFRSKDFHTEQDCLISCVLKQENIKCIYPYVPRAYHSGFLGYNRPGVKLKGTLNERISKLKTMSQQEMNDQATEVKDIVQIDCSVDYGVQKFLLK